MNEVTKEEIIEIIEKVKGINPGVAEYIVEGIICYHETISGKVDDYDKGEFNGVFDVLRAAGMLTLADKHTVRAYIRQRREERRVRQ